MFKSVRCTCGIASRGTPRRQQSFYRSLSIAAGRRYHDDDLRQVFDRPATRYGQCTSKRTGLFNYPQLATPASFGKVAKATLVQAQGLVDGIIHGPAHAKSMVKNFDRLSDLLCRLIDLAEFIRTAHPDPGFNAAAHACYEEMCSFMNLLNTEPALYRALRAVMDNPGEWQQLSREAQKVTLVFLRDFERSGIHLKEAQRRQHVELSDQIIMVGRQFLQNTEEAPSLGQTLSGSSHLETGLTMAERDRRDRYMALNGTRQDRVNSLEQLLYLRGRLAKLAGYESYGEMNLQDKLAGSPQNVHEFLAGLSAKTEQACRAEYRLLQKAKQKHLRLDTLPTIHAWDREFYMERARFDQAKHSLFPIDPYMSLGTVMQGLSRLFTALYGISLEPCATASGECWSNDIVRLNVIEESTGIIGVIYCDLWSRPGKSHGAAHFTVRCSRRVDDDISEHSASADQAFAQELLSGPEDLQFKSNGKEYQLPIVVLMCDFDPPDKQRPTLLQWNEVETIFHEMGHAMHSMIGRTDYQNVAGTRCATDFVELPSILMEYFLHDPSVLALFARHYKTDEPIPSELTQGQRHTDSAFPAIETQIQVHLASLDQRYHDREAVNGILDTTQILKETFNSSSGVNVFPHVPGTAWQANFGHLFGYGSTYYSYLLDRAIANRVWTQLFAKDPLSREAGHDYKERCLKYGGGQDPWQMVSDLLEGPDKGVIQGGQKAMEIVGTWGVGLSV